MKIGLLAVLAIMALSAPLSGQQNESIATVPSISIASRGEVKVNPDRANIQISVQTRATTAAAAAAENAVKQKAVIDALRALGIAAVDISTAGYNVYPETRYEPNREPVIIGYNVTNTLSIEIKTLTMIGPAIDAALAKGANMITSLQFYASNTDVARREAIGSAIQKARLDAEATARAAGGTLGQLLEVNIGAYFPPPPRPIQLRQMEGRVAAAPVMDTPINPGEQTVAVDVSTRWAFVGGSR